VPLIYKRDDARRRISLVLTEPLTDEELIRAIDRQLTEGTWSYGLLYDTRQLVSSARVAISRPAAAHVAAIAARVGRRGPVAILVSSADMAAMSEAHASRSRRSGQGVTVYWSPAAALEWLEAERSRGAAMPQARVEQHGDDYVITPVDPHAELEATFEKAVLQANPEHRHAGGFRVSQARLAETLAHLRELGFEVVHA
jgi:hypothetical protein